MNCCPYNCNQGRDCPARVAKAKPVMQAAEPLPPSTVKNKLKIACWWAVFGVLAAVLTANLPWIVYLVLRE